MRIGIWPEFSKDEQRLIRKDIKGIKATGLATPQELVQWAKEAIFRRLENAKKRQGEES